MNLIFVSKIGLAIGLAIGRFMPPGRNGAPLTPHPGGD
jgi:hypothetical protein